MVARSNLRPDVNWPLKRKQRSIIFGCLVFVTGGVFVLAGFVASAGESPPTLADITGFSRLGDDIIFSVVSNGCTTKADFEVALSDAVHPRNDSAATSIKLIRLRADRCKRISFAMPVVFSEAELGIQTALLFPANPVVSLKKLKR